jgi:predicted enzyme related to lactoylglutathione lyase
MSFKFRTFYFKVTDMPKAAAFWEGILQIAPHKAYPRWHEFMCGAVRFGLLLKDDDDVFNGCNGAPVFEFSPSEIQAQIDNAKKHGASVIIDGLENPNMQSIVLADPFGNEFEFTIFHS